jgi:5-methylcytosine-specific restriction endonuclease McrA
MSIKKGTRLDVLNRDRHRCRKCGATENLTMDHRLPRSMGGTDEEGNL